MRLFIWQQRFSIQITNNNSVKTKEYLKQPKRVNEAVFHVKK